ncbi:hypothetical protein TNIN_15101 [Trichonephila inaurata madagascariensis]|uniref:Uncharacterized protein n=1 Tax=Trichonephila inaurata madagascariensis TaxID=2747483 RepID=A0A8X6X6W0_9ARAC|nr:hypothetical protein TNIN_15101 [Trichonephila inaurata madagascariensis]
MVPPVQWSYVKAALMYKSGSPGISVGDCYGSTLCKSTGERICVSKCPRNFASVPLQRLVGDASILNLTIFIIDNNEAKRVATNNGGLWQIARETTIIFAGCRKGFLCLNIPGKTIHFHQAKCNFRRKGFYGSELITSCGSLHLQLITLNKRRSKKLFTTALYQGSLSNLKEQTGQKAISMGTMDPFDSWWAT